jgi:hypothetical protein
LLGAEGSTAVKNEALSYLEQLLTKPAASPTPQAPQASRQPSALANEAPISPARIASQSSALSGGLGTWSRIEIEPGLELHVHDQYQPPREAKGLRKLTQSILRVLESFGRKTGK